MTDETITKERQRLIKLWKAYEVQEKEYSEALRKILTQEKTIREANKMKLNLRQLIEEKNRELMELELKNTSLRTDLSELGPQMEERGRLLGESKKRYAKLYALTEELEEELERARREIKARDGWFKENISALENLHRSLDERRLLIESAVKGEEVSSGKIMLELEKPGFKDEIASVVDEEEPELKVEPSLEEVYSVEEEPKEEPELKVEPSLEEVYSVEEEPKEEGKGRIEVIKEFSKLESLNPTLANALYNKEITDLDQLRKTSTEDLLTVKGFDELKVESLRIDLMEL